MPDLIKMTKATEAWSTLLSGDAKSVERQQNISRADLWEENLNQL